MVMFLLVSSKLLFLLVFNVYGVNSSAVNRFKLRFNGFVRTMASINKY